MGRWDFREICVHLRASFEAVSIGNDEFRIKHDICVHCGKIITYCAAFMQISGTKSRAPRAINQNIPMMMAQNLIAIPIHARS